jgi:hypothetical protein
LIKEAIHPLSGYQFGSRGCTDPADLSRLQARRSFKGSVFWKSPRNRWNVLLTN